MKRKILIILSNRLDRNAKVRYLEVQADNEGKISKEHALRGQPKKAIYDEVWENDDGRTEFSSAYRFKRKYGHALQKKAKG